MFKLVLEIQDGTPPHLATEIITRQLKEQNKPLCDGTLRATGQIGGGFRYMLTKEDTPYYESESEG